jgi:hypothetical protein
VQRSSGGRIAFLVIYHRNLSLIRLVAAGIGFAHEPDAAGREAKEQDITRVWSD